MASPFKQNQAFIDSPACQHYTKAAIFDRINQVFPTGNTIKDKNIKLYQQGGFIANQLLNKMSSWVAFKDGLTVDTSSDDILNSINNRFDEVFEIELI